MEEVSQQPPLLPPPPPQIPLNVTPIKIKQPQTPSAMEKRQSQLPLPIKPRLGCKGKRVLLFTNYYKVTIGRAIDDFYHYNISIFYNDGSEITRNSVKRGVVEELSKMFKPLLDGKVHVYDGDHNLCTLGPLPQNILEFSVPKSLCIDQKRRKLSPNSKAFEVKISLVSKISMQDGTRLRVLNTIMQEQALKRGCLVVGQSFFKNEPTSCIDIGGGVLGCRGFFSSFKALQGGLFLNHDISMTTILQPGLVVTFLMSNQNVETPFRIDWTKVIQTLKNVRIKVKHLNSDYKVTGLSERSCKEQKFSMRLGEENGNVLTVVTTVYDYFVKTRGIQLKFSENLPCINVGRPNKPIFFPVELCYVAPLQLNTNELTVYQRSAMITKSSLKPEELVKVLADDAKRIKHEVEPLLKSCGVSINGSLVQAEGRVLQAPRLKMGNGEPFIPRNAWWNIKDKKLMEPKGLEHWAVVNFSSSCDVRKTCLELAKISSAKGMALSPPLHVLEENPKNKRKPPSVRVEMMFQQVQSRFRQHPPKFILCFLSDKKFSDLYGPWKRKTLVQFGILDQCISTSSNKIDELYLMNLVLKINVKLGGLNHTISSELTRTIPSVSRIPTMIIGIHVSHASSGRADAPSIASVVGSREWPRISSYRASLRALPPKVQIIDSLFKPMSQHEDAGIVRELLLEFHASSGQKKPAQIVIFRNGLSTSQFHEFLNVEMEQIVKASNFLEANWRPKFTVIASQRRHHTKFFDADLGANVSPGTIVDKTICDLQCTNFYMCAHTARIGTSRPTHYHILLDEIGFSSDDLQELIHSLSYVFQRSNRAISEVAPVRYARLAAAQMAQVIKPDKMMNTSECKGGYLPGNQLPKLHKNVSSSMFFI
ncbi:hypothetical protein ACS0TY_035769 [Phlomoides rotata]